MEQLEHDKTLQFIAQRYSINLENIVSPVKIEQSRWHDMGRLLNDLGLKKGIELGVYRGKFTATLAKRAPNMELIGIDAWKTYGDYRDYSVDDLENHAYQEALDRTKKFPNVKLLTAWSKDAASQFEDESLDFIFIDCNHNYEFVKEDLALWVPKIKPGGLVCGHDYFVSNQPRYGVVRAVNEWCEINNISPLFIWSDNIPSWMYVK
jgi:predicted O-methyltransferase YrrM